MRVSKDGKEFGFKNGHKIWQGWSGKNHPGWKGGSIAKVKTEALVRDDYTCQQCGLREPDIMEVDHILPKSIEPNLYISIDNLITLCPNDHRRKTKSDWKRYQWKRK